MNHSYHVTAALFEPSGSSCPLSMFPAHKAFRCLPLLWSVTGSDASNCPRLQPHDNPKLLFSKAPDLGSVLHRIVGAYPLLLDTSLHIHRNLASMSSPLLHRGHVQPTSPSGKIVAVSFPAMLLLPSQTHSSTKLSSLLLEKQTSHAYE